VVAVSFEYILCQLYIADRMLSDSWGCCLLFFPLGIASKCQEENGLADFPQMAIASW
jgi:hypothetical protein